MLLLLHSSNTNEALFWDTLCIMRCKVLSIVARIDLLLKSISVGDETIKPLCCNIMDMMFVVVHQHEEIRMNE